MKIGDKLLDTIMSDDDKGHIEAIARRHDIAFLDHAVAMMVGARSEEGGVLAHSVSFSVMNGAGNKALYLDAEECETPDEAYFVALHELGHSILKHHNNGKDDVTNEIEAWEWAINHAQRFPEDYTVETIINALSTYTDNAEGRARPDSLLALAVDPDLWVSKGWKFKVFKPLALSGMNPAPLVDKEGNVREVPQPFAKMLAEYIQFSKEAETQGLVNNMIKTLADPEMKKHITKSLGDVETLEKLVSDIQKAIEIRDNES